MSVVRNWSVRWKLAASFAVVAALFLIAIAFGVLSIASVGTETASGYRKAVLANGASAQAYNMRVSEGQDASQRRMVLNPDGTVMHSGDVAAFSATLSELHGLASSPVERAALAKADRAFASWKQADAYGEQLWRTGRLHASNAWQNGTANDRGDRLSQILFDFAHSEQVAADHNKASAVSSSQLVMIALSVLALALATGIVFLFGHHLGSRIGGAATRLDALRDAFETRMVGGLEAFANGDLTMRLVAGTRVEKQEYADDELGQLRRTVEVFRDLLLACYESYNTAAGNLRALMGELTAAAGNVGSASEQLATTSGESGRATGEIARAIESVAEGAEQQVSMVDAARRSSEEVTGAVAETAQNASHTAEMAADARQAAQDGVAAAEQADQAMRSVRESSEMVSSAISELASKSEQIGTIVETITQLSEQTNLLALNAAIEAARAGEHGKGFAVVAEEVRKLAEGSQRAAQEIAELIGTMQRETSKAVEVVEDGAQRTSDGVAVVERTREAFLSIGRSVDEMGSRVEQIAAAAQEIAASAESMQQNVDKVAQVSEASSASAEEVSASTQEGSASAQQIASTAQELASNAENLNRLVAQFKVTG